ncbi:Hypothetical Protein RRSL_03698 [Ralstonia solanacearum UW551]|uniref:Uncharacterized protein n=1 Tax=Ralstonia solanacearum (strain UW551) TaxID=342110 RepID=A0AB33VFL4_RALSU|nr:Hypothetical Protein RRSL_03698 [Ralstonia solanacearum UW551]
MNCARCATCGGNRSAWTTRNWSGHWAPSRTRPGTTRCAPRCAGYAAFDTRAARAQKWDRSGVGRPATLARSSQRRIGGGTRPPCNARCSLYPTRTDPLRTDDTPLW